MQFYRLYLIGDGHIRSAKQIEAENDDRAIAQAEELRGPEPAELWDRARVVRKFGHRLDATAEALADEAAFLPQHKTLES